MENKHRTAVAVLAMISIAIVYYLFSGSYGVTGERAYDHSMSLMSACNLKDADRVHRIQAMIAEDMQSQSIAPLEARWLNNIVDQALDGDWEVRKLMNAQVKSVR